jgi:hypothetical protein
VTIAAIQRDLQSTANASGRSDALATGVCDQASLPGAPAAGSEPAARLRLSIQLARWGLLSTVSEVKA